MKAEKRRIQPIETFAQPKALVENPHFLKQRQQTLSSLGDELIDAPIVELIDALNGLPHCFTLQSCYGHFVYTGQNDRHNMQPLPTRGVLERVEYRIAYICLCVENSEPGKGLLELLRQTVVLDPDNIQFGSAEWFWDRQVNSYALQVEPDRFKHQDSALLDYREALHIERVRNQVFDTLKKHLVKSPSR